MTDIPLGPDPSERAREDLFGAIEHLRELLETRISALSTLTDERFEAVDRQTKIALDAQKEAIAAAALADEKRLAQLREYFDRRIDEVEKSFTVHLEEARVAMAQALKSTERAIDAALAASTKAVDKAEMATEKRFEGVNEFRGQLDDQAKTLLRRDMFDQHVRDSNSRLETLYKRVEANTNQLTAIQSASGGSKDKSSDLRGLISVVVGVGALLIAIVAIVIPLMLR